jgi:hypothetical protein
MMVGTLIPEGVSANVKRICAEVVQAAAEAGHPVRNVWGFASSADHNNRRCIDFMVTSKARGDWVAKYVWRHRKRLGLDLYIWNRAIIRNYWRDGLPPGLARSYWGASPHTDHVHVQFKAGSYVPLETARLDVYVVDPAKVDSFLWELSETGHQVAKRKPGYKVRRGVYWMTLDGRKWLVLSNGHRLAAEYLRRA